MLYGLFGRLSGGYCTTDMWHMWELWIAALAKFPVFWPDEEAVAHFLERIFLPRLEKRGSIKQPEHEAGWALSDHGRTRIGKMVRASKYEEAGPFPEELVLKRLRLYALTIQ